MLLEALFSAVAEAVFGYLLQKSDPVERACAIQDAARWWP